MHTAVNMSTASQPESSGSLARFSESESCDGDGYQSDQELSLTGESSTPATPPKKKRPRVVHSKTRFNPEWTKKHPCIIKQAGDSGKAYCTVCNKALSVSHQGYADVERHINGQVHLLKSKEVESNRKITQCFVSNRDSLAMKVIGAEVKFTSFVLEHNLPIAVVDHAGPLFRSMFPDSKIAQYYGSGRTKTTSIINEALAPGFSSLVYQQVQQQPFTLSLDGSNDAEEKKLVPLTVRVFDNEHGVVKTKFLSMCLLNAGTAIAYFEKLEEVFVSNNIPWSNCIALSVDSASVNIGRHNSIKSRLESKNPSVYTLGCPCHFIHNAAHNAAKKLEVATGFDVEEFIVDIYYYFEHSTKRKGELHDYAAFCDVAYRKVLKHVSTRWLSLKTCIERILKQYPALRSYFLSQEESASDRRLSRLQASFLDPMTEAYLMFLQSVLPLFTTANILLQSESPCIHILLDVMKNLLQKLLGRFITVEALDAVSSTTSVPFEDRLNQLDNSGLMIGFTTKQLIHRLMTEVEPSQISKFYVGAREFFIGSASYLTRKFSWNDPVLQHAQFVVFQKRKSVSFQSVEYFMTRFPQHCQPPANRIDDVYDEFCVYQSLQALPQEVVDVTETENEECKIQPDRLWHELGKQKDVNGKKKFGLLSLVAKVVLTLPHSNADEERIFSLVRKNKTMFRPNLSLDKTLPSIIQCKVNFFSDTKCYEFTPSKDLLQKAKQATWKYNREHSS